MGLSMLPLARLLYEGSILLAALLQIAERPPRRASRLATIRRLTACCSIFAAVAAATPSRSIYVTLAFLMGGGLVLFGIGGDTSGGLVDALTGSGSAPDTSAEALREPGARGARRHEDGSRRTRRRGRSSCARASSCPPSAERYDANTDTYTARGQGQARAGRAGLEALPCAGAEGRGGEVPRRIADGAHASSRSSSSTRPRSRRRSSPTRATPPAPTPSSRSSPTRPGRPARATSPPRRRSS